MADLQGPPAPGTHRPLPRYAPVAPIGLTVVLLAVAAGAALLMRRADDVGNIYAPVLYELAEVGLVAVLFRALVARARYFVPAGVPEGWSRPPLRGVSDPDLRRWQAVIAERREAAPEERDVVLAAARARSEGLASIMVPGLAAFLTSAMTVVLIIRLPDSLLTLVGIPNLPAGLIVAAAVLVYGSLAERARAYLQQYGASSGT
ncbi:hypothetical protein [Actinoplanes sp. HUAS TT8]|uniref:hypothetical protein n=1 Tax=Actinoplanes sp. HUAS TT8 TaxID=3447453 RepID=UPI003F5233F2